MRLTARIRFHIATNFMIGGNRGQSLGWAVGIGMVWWSPSTRTKGDGCCYGDLARARALAERTEARWSEVDGEAELPQQRLLMRASRATVLRTLGNFTEALALDQAVLAEQRATVGLDFPRTR